METNSGIESKARELLEGRIASVTNLSATIEHLDQVRATIAAAEKSAAAAWSTATEAGWTEAELRQLGFTRPAAKRPGRATTAPRARKHTAGVAARAGEQ